jgi:hypothetical protein
VTDRGETGVKNKASWAPADLIIPVFALGLSVYYISTIWDVPPMAQWYGGALSLVNIAFFAAALFCMVKNGVFGKLPKTNPGIRRALTLACMVAAYIALLPVLGYCVSSFLFIGSVMYFLKARSFLRIIACALFVSLLGFVLFVLVLDVAIPLDPVSEEIKRFVIPLFR